MTQLKYTGTYMEPIKLVDCGGQEIMLHAAKNPVIEVSEGCAAVIQALYPDRFQTVTAEPAPEARPVKSKE